MCLVTNTPCDCAAPQPLAELVFKCFGKQWLAWIADEIEDGCRDVAIYEIKGGGFRFEGIGVFGVVGLNGKPDGRGNFVCYAIDKQIESAANAALKMWKKKHV